MKSGLSFLSGAFVVLVLIPSLSLAYPFLTKSKLLKELNAQVLIGENQTDVIVFDKDVLKEYRVSEDGSDTYLISNDGLIPLMGKTSEKDLFDMCANPYPGVGFSKEGKDALFIAVGENLKKSIHWHPAKKINRSPSHDCFSDQVPTGANHSSYRSGVIDAYIHQARWDRQLTISETEKNCRGFADWNAKLDSKVIANELYDQCLEGAWVCRAEERLFIALDAKDGNCGEITNSSIDCDGKAGIRENLGEFLGVIIVSSGTSKEIWLIWNAPGYEGNGVYGIELEDVGKEERPSEEWLVYNGC